MLQTAASVAVPKMMMHIQTILCPEEYDVWLCENIASPFSAVIIFIARISAVAGIS
jgi:hypothetical protein